jgi:dihydroorotate dehydrogenase (NAD+) catalytic subunit
MIRLSSGASFMFIISAGARGWAGRDEGHGLAHLWKVPFRLLGLMDTGPSVPVVSKTVTRHPRRGRYRWWKPWQTIRLVPGGVVNAMALPNPGIVIWIEEYYRDAVSRGIPFVLSIAPESADEAAEMATMAEKRARRLAALEINLSCPNVQHGEDDRVDFASRIVRAALSGTSHPVILKLGVQDPYLDICKRVDGEGLAAFHLINAVPWRLACTAPPSPLAGYGYDGAVSGRPIVSFARDALRRAKFLNLATPVVSGGGVGTAGEALARFEMGADAVGLGSQTTLRAPWAARQIVKSVQPSWKLDVAL